MLSLKKKETLFSMYKKHFILATVSCAQKTVFLSSAETTKCFLCTENGVSFFCQYNKMFHVHRGQCFFLMLRQQSVSYAQIFSKTGQKVFPLQKEDSISFLYIVLSLKTRFTQIYYYTVYKCLHCKYYVIPNSTGNSSDACCNGGQLARKKGVWC